ncbi:MAG: hypothetical protein WAV45_06525 [Propionibacteriaceae bacterium]|nr:hypothetical protein [Micropruina sp.]HBX82076.1 hypothetical protein [Propionibacteriaceae bacterium]
MTPRITLGTLAASVVAGLALLAGCTAAAPATSGGQASGTLSPAAATSSSAPTPTAPALRANGKPACDWLTVEQVTAALGANAPAVTPGYIVDDELNEGMKIHLCNLFEKPFNRVAPTIWTFPSAAAAQSYLDDMEHYGCVAVEGLGGRAEYCQSLQAKPEQYTMKNLNVLVSGTVIHQLYWSRAGDHTTVDIQAQLIALYKQAQFPA